jgi:hypothetical protein
LLVHIEVALHTPGKGYARKAVTHDPAINAPYSCLM